MANTRRDVTASVRGANPSAELLRCLPQHLWQVYSNTLTSAADKCQGLERLGALVVADHESNSKKINPLKLRPQSSADLHFKIWHRFRAPGTECAAGEEVAAVSFVTYQGEFHLPLSLTLRLVFDFLARHRHVPLGAGQIAASFRADPFYREHGCNALKTGALIRRVSISSVRVYIERIRRAMTLSFREANLRIDSRNVLVSEETVTNEVGYRLRGTFEWLHTDHPGREFAWVR